MAPRQHPDRCKDGVAYALVRAVSPL